MDHYMLHVEESVNLTIYLYAQIMGQQRMLYVRKFYVVKNIYIGTQLQWRVTNMARNDLRARGGLGGREAPPQQLVGNINDDRDTGNARLAITINKAQGQSE